MIYFLLPKTDLNTYKQIEFQDRLEISEPFICNALSYYLSNIKEKMHEYNSDWNVYKKYTNPYEYIHTMIPNKKKCVSKHAPLSRSYFKMIELAHVFKLKDFTIDFRPANMSFHTQLNMSSRYLGSEPFIRSHIQAHKTFGGFAPRTSWSPGPPCPPGFGCVFSEEERIYNNEYISLLKSKKTPIRSFHLAEGPGGFIEAFVEMRNNTEDEYIGMTLLDDDKMDMNIPAWKKSQYFLKENSNVFIENGADQTGNILNIQNFIYCKEKYKSSMDLITADGKCTFSVDCNNPQIPASPSAPLLSQEQSNIQLLFAQIAFALCMQKKNGSFVLKIFDSFMLHTIDLLFLLSSFYEKIYITKPHTSRYANSEKYIVCKTFLFDSCDDFYPFLLEAFTKMISSEKKVFRFLNVPIPNHFLTKLEEYNSIFGQQQIENIYYTISLIETKNKTEKMDHLIKTNIQKCIHWCIRYIVPYNQIIHSNLFLNNGV